MAKRDQLVREVTAAYESFEFSKAAQLAYDFAWHDFADWYIEATKADSYKLQATSPRILIETLEVILKLLHPAMPFVTERLYQALQESGIRNQESRDRNEMLITSRWPQPIHDSSFIIHNSVGAFDFLRELVTVIRQIRSDKKIEPKTLVDVVCTTNDTQQLDWLYDSEFIALVQRFARASDLRIGEITAPHATVRATTIHVEAAIGQP